MRYSTDIPNVPDEEMEAIIKDVELEKQRQDQLGIEETKQAEKPKSKTISLSENWIEKTVATLVKFRKDPNTNGEILTTIRGGDIIKVSSSFSHHEFDKVKYKNKEGYVMKKYVRDL